jgi:hypothetical protein
MDTVRLGRTGETNKKNKRIKELTTNIISLVKSQ